MKHWNNYYHIIIIMQFSVYLTTLFAGLKWATPFKIHTPPAEDFGKVHGGGGGGGGM